RPIIEVARILAREGDALRHALIDNIQADLRQAIDVTFAGAEVAAFDGVIEQAINAVAVIVIILGGVNAALRGDAVRPAWRILKTKTLDPVTQLAEGRSRSPSGQTRPDHDDVVLALVRRIHQLEAELVPIPSGLDRSAGRVGI